MRLYHVLKGQCVCSSLAMDTFGNLDDPNWCENCKVWSAKQDTCIPHREREPIWQMVHLALLTCGLVGSWGRVGTQSQGRTGVCSLREGLSSSGWKADGGSQGRRRQEQVVRGRWHAHLNKLTCGGGWRWWWWCFCLFRGAIKCVPCMAPSSGVIIKVY